MAHQPFANEAAFAYADGAPRKVPGLASLHQMVTMLLAERVPSNGRVLVLGAGGGMELAAFAKAQAQWSFDGVDPSPDMLRVAQQTLAQHAARVRLIEGFIDSAPEGPYDGATALLTLHFIAREQRLATLQQIHRRLHPGAPFVMAHLSFAQAEPERSLWIARHIAFGAANGAVPANLDHAKQAIGAGLSILAPDEEEAMLRAAGFSGSALFYAGLSFRGWVAYRS